METGKAEAVVMPGRNRGDHVQEVYVRLRDFIVRGRMSPGSRLVEADLAARLGVSRTPIRSALLKLQQEGYVVETGKGRQSRLSVSPLTSEDAYELWWIMGAVEGVAIRWAAKLEEGARRALVEEMTRINRQLHGFDGAEQRDASRIFELDSAFHRSFVEVSAGPRVLSLHSGIRPQTERYWRLYTTSIVDKVTVSAGEHDAIIEAIAAGDPNAAQRAVEHNWQQGADRLVQAIEDLGELGSW